MPRVLSNFHGDERAHQLFTGLWSHHAATPRADAWGTDRPRRSVFRHGFPDEDTEWTLDGNVDAEYKKLHDADKTPKASLLLALRVDVSRWSGVS